MRTDKFEHNEIQMIQGNSNYSYPTYNNHCNNTNCIGYNTRDYNAPQGDRFIPCRSAAGNRRFEGMLDCSPVDMSISDTDSENSYNSKCSECAYKALIQENYNMFCMPDNRVLHFAQNPMNGNLNQQSNATSNSAMLPTSSDKLCNSLQVAYEKAKKTLDEKKSQDVGFLANQSVF